ncbi:MAG: hypothetical protein IJ496_00705 [Ruminococcus sp.]|nr:hypothetical protein [Ruminococcus sp.]
MNRYYYTNVQSDFCVGIQSSMLYDNTFSDLTQICICEKKELPYTDAVSFDVIGHEFTHGVFNKFALEDAFGADGYTVKGINEGYADVFGSFMDDDDWLHGESITGNSVIESDRNAANPPTFEIDFNSSITE